MKMVRKAFNAEGREIPYAMHEGDFVCEIPEGFTLKKAPKEAPVSDPKMQAKMDEAMRDLIKALDQDCRKHPRGLYDMSDLGNVVGLTVAKYFRSDLPGCYDKEAFLAGLKHGFSLVDGTH